MGLWGPENRYTWVLLWPSYPESDGLSLTSSLDFQPEQAEQSWGSDDGETGPRMCGHQTEVQEMQGVVRILGSMSAVTWLSLREGTCVI